MEELVSQKKRLIESRKAMEAEAITLRHELEKARGVLAQAKEELTNAQAKVVEAER